MSETVASPTVGTRIWVLVGVLFVVHFFLHVGVGFGRGAPDLATIALLLAARDVGLGRAAALGLAFGLLEDALSVLAFGANAIAMTIVGVGGALTRDVFVGDSRLFLVWYLLVGKWLRDLVHWIAVGSDVRLSAVLRKTADGWRFIHYAEAPLGALPFLRRVYNANVRGG